MTTKNKKQKKQRISVKAFVLWFFASFYCIEMHAARLTIIQPIHTYTYILLTKCALKFCSGLVCFALLGNTKYVCAFWRDFYHRLSKVSFICFGIQSSVFYKRPHENTFQRKTGMKTKAIQKEDYFLFFICLFTITLLLHKTQFMLLFITLFALLSLLHYSFISHRAPNVRSQFPSYYYFYTKDCNFAKI